MENFVSKLCIFNEQTSLDFSIVQEDALRRELMKNYLKNSHVGKALNKKRLVYLFVHVTLDELLGELKFLRQAMKKSEQVQSKQAEDIEDLRRQVAELIQDREQEKPAGKTGDEKNESKDQGSK